ncbi:biotin--[acetyl-CoA-carboxylase] ligase [Capnocytophaga sp. HP1101]
MNIITLKSVDSTNQYLKKLIHTEDTLPNFLTVWTPQQTAGVGQYGAKWTSEPYQNLTFSVLFLPEFLDLKDAFLLNMLVPIAIMKVLEKLNIPNINIKWPNDILSQRYKIGGILIENTIQKNRINKCVIGIGLNLNQTNFDDLPKASSLKKLTKKDFEVEQVMKLILSELESNLSTLTQQSFKSVYPIYQSYLFQLNKVSTFRSPEGETFSSIIRGVEPSGKLIVETEQQAIKTFSLKEITLLY